MYKNNLQSQRLAFKNVIIKNFRILCKDPETKHISPLPPLISFERDKNIGNFPVRSEFKSDDQPGIKCERTRCKTCPLISNIVRISGPSRSAKVTDHFACIFVYVNFSITCTLCKKIYIGKNRRKIGELLSRTPTRFRKKTYRRVQTSYAPFNLPNHSHHNMTNCGLSLHHGNTESRKNLKQKFIFQLGTLSPHGINEHL